MRNLRVIYYNENDKELARGNNWINKNAVSIYEGNELVECFTDSIYEEINFKACMDYLQQHYPQAKIIKDGILPTGYDYFDIEIEE